MGSAVAAVARLELETYTHRKKIHALTASENPKQREM